MADNKAAQQSTKQMNADIESAKLEVLEKIASTSNKVLAPVANIQKAVNLCTKKFTKSNDLLNRNANNLKNVLKSLNAIKDQLKNNKGNEKDGKISNLLKGVIVGAAGRKTAVAPKNEDLGKLADTVKLIAKQQVEQTKAADKNAQRIVQGATAQTKTVLLNQDKVEKAKERKEKVGDNRQKPTLPSDDKKKKRGERPKLPFSMKEFLKGLGGILSGILNPVSIITSMIVKFLPYVLLAVAFFMGVWDSLSEDLKEKAIKLGKKIAKYALTAFALFKGPVVLIKTLETIYHTARMIGLTAKWGKDMILWAFQMKGEAKKQKAEGGFLLFRKAKEIIRHIAEMLGIAFRNGLAVLQFLFACAGVILVVAAIVLVIVGIIYIFAKFGDQITKAIKSIIEVFKDIGGLIVDACIGFFKIIFSPIIALIEGIAEAIAKAFFGKADEANAKQTTRENALVEKQKDSYSELVDKVTSPLHSIRNAVESLRDFFVGKPIEANRDFMTPRFNAFPESTQISNMTMANAVTIKSNDSLGDNINTNYVGAEEGSDYTKNIKEIGDTLAEIQKSLTKFFKDYRPPRGSGGGYANK